MDTSPVVAVLDANVLYPRYLRDTLLRMAESDLYTVRWSVDILDELSRNLLKDRATPERVEWLLHEMRASFPEAEVTGYHAQIEVMPVDRKDRHVAAAAVAGHAHVIVTDNLRDFPQQGLAPLQIEALSADAFLARLVQANPERVADVINVQAADYRKPPLIPMELLGILGKRVPGFAHLARASLASSG